MSLNVEELNAAIACAKEYPPRFGFSFFSKEAWRHGGCYHVAERIADCPSAVRYG